MNWNHQKQFKLVKKPEGQHFIFTLFHYASDAIKCKYLLSYDAEVGVHLLVEKVEKEVVVVVVVVKEGKEDEGEEVEKEEEREKERKESNSVKHFTLYKAIN